jgi:hypothetical protein
MKNRKSFISWSRLDEAHPKDLVDFYEKIWQDERFKDVQTVQVRTYERTVEQTLPEEFGRYMTVNAKPGYSHSHTVICFSTWRKVEASQYGVWWELKIARVPGCSSHSLDRVMNPEELDLEAHNS